MLFITNAFQVSLINMVIINIYQEAIVKIILIMYFGNMINY